MSSKFNADGALLFEQPFARVPYEAYRKVFRTSQKYIEREFGAVQTTTKELTQQSKSNNLKDMSQSVDNMITRVEGLKRKLSTLYETSGLPTEEVMRERFEHISELEKFTSRNDPGFNRWSDTRVDRWLVDWSLRNGKEKTARLIAEDRNIERLVDIELFSEIHRIEDALRRHSCTEALAWCSENKATLRKAKNTLEFDLRLQEYIELTRANKKIEAKTYASKHLVAWRDTHLQQIMQASALLCMPEDRAFGVYKRLYSPTRWETLVQSFRLSVYSLNSLPVEPLLHLVLYGGLASLKLPVCYSESSPESFGTVTSSRNADCPICDTKGLGALAKEVPWSHHVNSTIVCSLSGAIMDADNPPMAFPNGYVYSRKALQEMSAKLELLGQKGKVVCPRTSLTCDFNELRKVFVS